MTTEHATVAALTARFAAALAPRRTQLRNVAIGCGVVAVGMWFALVVVDSRPLLEIVRYVWPLVAVAGWLSWRAQLVIDRFHPQTGSLYSSEGALSLVPVERQSAAREFAAFGTWLYAAFGVVALGFVAGALQMSAA